MSRHAGPSRLDPALVALRRVAIESARLREAIEQLDEAGGPGRALQVGVSDADLRRAAGQIREARDGLSVTLGRLAGLARAGCLPADAKGGSDGRIVLP